MQINDVTVYNAYDAISGIRFSHDSFDLFDSTAVVHDVVGYSDLNASIEYYNDIVLGENDKLLVQRLVKAGSSHRKFLRQIFVSMKLTAPIYLWKQLDTYKVATVRNSESTMHTITKYAFTESDFDFTKDLNTDLVQFDVIVDQTIRTLNHLRNAYINTRDKRYWTMLIELLPSSYLQTSIWTVNLETLLNIYDQRKTHKLKDWVMICDYIKAIFSRYSIEL